MNTIMGVPVMRRRCVSCKELIVDDGYGDVVHEGTMQYKCDSKSNEVAK